MCPRLYSLLHPSNYLIFSNIHAKNADEIKFACKDITKK